MTALLASIGWTLRRSRLGLASLMLGIAIFELIQPVAIESFGNLDRLQPFLELVPPSFWALMNVTPDFLTSVGLAGYLSLGFSHPIFIILSATTVVWFASRVLAGEMERGSIQFALSRPVSRASLYLSRFVGVLIVTTLTAAIGPLGMLAGLQVSSPQGEFTTSHLIVVGIAVWALIWAIAGSSLFWSAGSNTMSQAIGISIGVLVVSYVIDYFAALWSVLKPIAPISIFHYYQPSSALAGGSLAGRDMLVLGLVGGVGAVAGLVRFTRRDLPV